MKKIFLALAIIASCQFANAQVKTVAAAKEAVETAEKDAANPKKASKYATWIKLGQAYIDSYNSTRGNGWVGASEQDLSLVMGKTKPTSSSVVNCNGEQYTKNDYSTFSYYFNQSGVLSMIEITEPIYKDALEKAAEAFNKASELDVKKAKAKDIDQALQTISKSFAEDGVTYYNLGDFANASNKFEKAGLVTESSACSIIDTSSFYNAGFIALSQNNTKRAKELFEKCLNQYGYEGTDGEIYAKLAAAYDIDNDKAKVKEYLEKGFAKHPQSQSILIGLINYYIGSGEDTGRLFELIDDAKKNEPDNASLYYVEGNINSELGNFEKAIAAYEKCAEINPEYEFGFIGEGILYYNQAIKIQEEAQNELDDNKYMKLAADFETALKNCIVPFEKAFNITKDNSLKVNIAEYLKNACYRFSEDATYKEAYDKYNAIVKAGTAE